MFRRAASSRLDNPHPAKRRKKPICRLRLDTLQERVVPSISVLQSFKGLNTSDGGGLEPPDTTMGVGRTSVVEAVNAAIRITTKGGGNLGPVQPFSDVFAPIMRPDSLGFGDPYVLYDDQVDRFCWC